MDDDLGRVKGDEEGGWNSAVIAAVVWWGVASVGGFFLPIRLNGTPWPGMVGMVLGQVWVVALRRVAWRLRVARGITWLLAVAGVAFFIYWLMGFGPDAQTHYAAYRQHGDLMFGVGWWFGMESLMLLVICDVLKRRSAGVKGFGVLCAVLGVMFAVFAPAAVAGTLLMVVMMVAGS